MKDRKLTEIQDAVKDIDNIVDFLEDKEDAIKKLESLESEAFRLQYITELAKKLVSVRNEFFSKAVKLDNYMYGIEKSINEIRDQRAELIEQLARQRIITSDLTGQIVNMKKILETAKVDQKSLDELLVKTKEYLIECSCCHTRVNGTMDEIMNPGPCAKCGDKAMWEIRTRMLA